MTDYAPTSWQNLPTQTSPVNATNLNKLEAAVDVLADAVRQASAKKALAATTANITLSGVQTVDDIALSTGQRCFVWKQTNAAQNGLYIVAAGAWSRAPEADDSSELAGGTIISVERGTQNGGKTFRCTNSGTVTINTTALTFAEISGAVGGGGTSYLTNGTTPLKYSAFLAAASGNHQTAFQNAINHIFTSAERLRHDAGSGRREGRVDGAGCGADIRHGRRHEGDCERHHRSAVRFCWWRSYADHHGKRRAAFSEASQCGLRWPKLTPPGSSGT